MTDPAPLRMSEEGEVGWGCQGVQPTCGLGKLGAREIINIIKNKLLLYSYLT